MWCTELGAYIRAQWDRQTEGNKKKIITGLKFKMTVVTQTKHDKLKSNVHGKKKYRQFNLLAPQFYV
jgi:hypothetical protein